MKVESVKVNFAVADRISRKNILEMMSKVAVDPETGFYGVEIEEDWRFKAPTEVGIKFMRRKTLMRRKMSDGTTIEDDVASAADVPRKKRKYTRRVKAAEETGVKVSRRKLADGTTIENRGNCQGGGAV